MRKRVNAGSPRIAIAYIRVSKDEQKLGPEAKRAALSRALSTLREHGAGILAVAKRDRLARDVVLTAMVERAAEACGACVVSAAGEGNGKSPADAFMRTVIDGAAAYERGLIRARTKAALAAKKARGEVVGQVPYGFVREGDRLVSVLSEQATIARAHWPSRGGRSALSQRTWRPRATSAARVACSPQLKSRACWMQATGGRHESTERSASASANLGKAAAKSDAA